MNRNNIRTEDYTLLLFIITFFVSPAIAEEINPMEMICSLTSAYEDVRDYTAILYKQETVRGILHREEKVLFKFKKPFDIYMRWLKGPGESREILYNPEENDGKMVIKPHGFIAMLVPTLYLDPENPLVKTKSRHTIKEAGIGKAIEFLTKELELAKKHGDLKIEFIDEETMHGSTGSLGPARIYSKISAFLPEGKSYYAGRIIIYIDKEYTLPAGVFVYDWKDNLLEKAFYTELKINVGLKKIDFDPKNPGYGFKVK